MARNLKLAFSIMVTAIGVHMSACEYVFQVHTTKSCPKNRIEMDERSRALNCSKSNGYTCLPNEDITVLVEFCYKRARIPVTKGVCLILRRSDVDGYQCEHFIHGCPDADYFTDEIYKYPQCSSIGNGSFLAEPIRDRISTAYTSSISTVTGSSKETGITTRYKTYWVWIVTCLVLIVIFTSFCILCIIRLKNKLSAFNAQSKRYVRGTKICDDVDVELQSLIRTYYENKSSSADKVTTKDDGRQTPDNAGEIETSVKCKVNGENSSDEVGFSALYKACEEGNATDVALLLGGGADVNIHVSLRVRVSSVHNKIMSKNRIEMDERSHALNCTKSNGYTCLPIEDITVLVEFCYKRARIPVTKGFCLILRRSDVDGYQCENFIHGCPDADYFTDEIYKYPQCLSIGNGCFLADPLCDRISTAGTSTNSNVTGSSKETGITTRYKTDWIWIVAFLVLIVIFTSFCILCIIRLKNKYHHNNTMAHRI